MTPNCSLYSAYGSVFTQRNSCLSVILCQIPSFIHPHASLFTLISVLLKSIDDYLYQWLVHVRQSFHSGSYQKLYVFLMSAYQGVCHGISVVWWDFENICCILPQQRRRGLLPARPSPLLYYLWKWLCNCAHLCECVYASECKSHMRQLTALIASSKIQSQFHHYSPFAATVFCEPCVYWSGRCICCMPLCMSSWMWVYFLETIVST